MPGLDDIYEVQDYSPQTLTVLVQRLQASRTQEHLIYRECELDEVWRLLDLEIASLRTTAQNAPGIDRLTRIRDTVMATHDQVGITGDPAAAAERLRPLTG